MKNVSSDIKRSDVGYHAGQSPQAVDMSPADLIVGRKVVFPADNMREHNAFSHKADLNLVWLV